MVLLGTALISIVVGFIVAIIAHRLIPRPLGNEKIGMLITLGIMGAFGARCIGLSYEWFVTGARLDVVVTAGGAALFVLVFLFFAKKSEQEGGEF